MTTPTPTFADRLRWTWWRVSGYWPAALLFWAIAAGSLYGAVVNGHWSLWLVGLVSLLTPLAFAVVEYARGGAAYTVDGVRCVWGPEAVAQGSYRHPDQMRGQLLDPWWRGTQERGGWQGWAKREGVLQSELIAGCELRFIGDEPSLGWYRDDEQDEDPADDIIPDVSSTDPGIQSYGKTYAGARYSVVYAPHATKMGTAGHELDLLAWPKAFPGKSRWRESAKVKHLRELGIK